MPACASFDRLRMRENLHGTKKYLILETFAWEGRRII